MMLIKNSNKITLSVLERNFREDPCLYLGSEKSGQQAWLTRQELGGHFLCIGKNSEGVASFLRSTVTQVASWSSGFIYAGRYDSETYTDFNQILNQMGFENLLVLNLAQPDGLTETWNPLDCRTEEEIVTLLLDLFSLSKTDSYQSFKAILLMASVLSDWRKHGRTATFRSLHHWLKQGGLQQASTSVSLGASTQVHLSNFLSELSSSGKTIEDALEGPMRVLDILSVYDALNPPLNSSLDLLEIFNNRRSLYIGLNAHLPEHEKILSHLVTDGARRVFSRWIENEGLRNHFYNKNSFSSFQQKLQLSPPFPIIFDRLPSEAFNNDVFMVFAMARSVNFFAMVIEETIARVPFRVWANCSARLLFQSAFQSPHKDEISQERLSCLQERIKIKDMETPLMEGEVFVSSTFQANCDPTFIRLKLPLVEIGKTETRLSTKVPYPKKERLI